MLWATVYRSGKLSTPKVNDVLQSLFGQNELYLLEASKFGRAALNC